MGATSKALLLLALTGSSCLAEGPFSRGDVESRPPPLSPVMRSYLKQSNPLIPINPVVEYQDGGACAKGQFYPSTTNCAKYFQASY